MCRASTADILQYTMVPSNHGSQPDSANGTATEQTDSTALDRWCTIAAPQLEGDTAVPETQQKKEGERLVGTGISREFRSER